MPDTMVLMVKSKFNARYDGSNAKNQKLTQDTMVLTLKNNFRTKELKKKVTNSR